jgi:hypothetical protein
MTIVDGYGVLFSISLSSVCHAHHSPGAGKSTISEEAARSLIGYDSLRQHHFLHLDLDVCVPQWMRVRPNFEF